MTSRSCSSTIHLVFECVYPSPSSPHSLDASHIHQPPPLALVLFTLRFPFVCALIPKPLNCHRTYHTKADRVVLPFTFSFWTVWKEAHTSTHTYTPKLHTHTPSSLDSGVGSAAGMLQGAQAKRALDLQPVCFHLTLFKKCLTFWERRQENLFWIFTFVLWQMVCS